MQRGVSLPNEFPLVSKFGAVGNSLFPKRKMPTPSSFPRVGLNVFGVERQTINLKSRFGDFHSFPIQSFG